MADYPTPIAPPMVAPAGSKITTIPLGNKPYATPYYSLGREICHNMYLEIAQTEFSKAQYYLIKIPGLRRFGSVPASNLGPCRAMFTTSAGKTIVVNGNVVSEILYDGTLSTVGLISSQAGPVSIAENGKEMILVDGTAGWIYCYADAVTGLPTFAQIVDEYFPGNSQGTKAPTHVCYLNSYFIVNNPNSNQYYWSSSFYQSDLNNTQVPYSPSLPNGYWTPLQTGQKIARSDNISGLTMCNQYIWLFGYNSCEVHQDTGNYNGQQFARYQGAILNVGCSAPYSIATYQNNVFWLGSDNTGTLGVFTNDGMTPVRISTRGIEQMMEEITWTDCQAYTYSQAGHNFYVMQFPTSQRTFVYDMVTGAWHERTALIRATGALNRWHGQYCTNNYGKHIIGDTNTSAYYILDMNYGLNDNPIGGGFNTIRCCKTTPIGFSSGQNVRYNSAQVICNQGTGLRISIEGVGDDPQIQLAWSDDCGVTWSNELEAPIGRQGEFAKRSMVLGCGMGRNRVWRITMTDPVPFILVALVINGSPCRF